MSLWRGRKHEHAIVKAVPFRPRPQPISRRQALLAGAAAILGAAPLDAQTLLSTRGHFLDWSEEEERYWFFDVDDGLNRFRRLASADDRVELREIARTVSGFPIRVLRAGQGPKSVAILSGMHGCEPSGPRGCLGYLDALLNARKPFGIAVDAPRILSALTLYVVPLLNPGGAERFSRHFPDSWHGTWLRAWTDADADHFFAEANEPVHFFYGTYVKKPPMRFTPDQIAKWEATGNVLGSSLTDQGLDLWFDWDDTHGVQTRAVKALLDDVRPWCVADFHNFMFPTEVFAPTVYSTGAIADEERHLAQAMQQAWRARQLRFNDHVPRPYPKPAAKYYEDYWFHQLGARTLIIEANGGMLATSGAEYQVTPGARPLTRRESLEEVVAGIDALVNAIVTRGTQS